MLAALIFFLNCTMTYFPEMLNEDKCLRPKSRPQSWGRGQGQGHNLEAEFNRPSPRPKLKRPNRTLYFSENIYAIKTQRFKIIEFEFRVKFRVTRKCNWWNSVRNNFAPYLGIICMLLCIIQLDKFQQSSTGTRWIELHFKHTSTRNSNNSWKLDGLWPSSTGTASSSGTR